MVELPDGWDPAPMIEHALATVTETLREDGGFIPFAITVDGAGQAEGVFPESIDDSGDSSGAFEALVEALRDEAEAGDHAAVALLVDTQVREGADGEPRDAILIHLEYRAGASQRTILLYELEERPGDGATPYHLELGDPETMPADPMIFDPA